MRDKETVEVAIENSIAKTLEDLIENIGEMVVEMRKTVLHARCWE